MAGYIRISSERDGMEAPDIYRSEIEEWCRRQGKGDPVIFEDLDYSGRKDSKPRPQLQAMLRRRKSFSAVVVPRLDRLGRSVRDAIPVFDLLTEEGIDFIALDVPGLDSTSSSGKLVRDILLRLAEFQSDQISDTWKSVHRHLRKGGRRNGGGSTPYGYDFVSKRMIEAGDDRDRGLHINEAQAAVVRELFDRYLDGDSIHTLTDDLNARGVPTQRGGTWSRSVVGYLLENPAYAGVQEYDGELRPATWQAIVDRATWERAAAMRKVTRDRSRTEVEALEVDPRSGTDVFVRKLVGHRPPASGRFLLSGLLHCGECGRRMHHKSNLYICPDKACPEGGVSAGRAEGFVAAAFTDYLTSSKGRKALERKRKRHRPERSVSTTDAIDKKITRLVDQLAESGPGGISAIKKKLAKLEEDRAEAERRQLEVVVDGVEEEAALNDVSGFLGDMARHVGEFWAPGTLYKEDGTFADPTVQARFERLVSWHEQDIRQRRQVLAQFIESVRTVPGTRPRQVEIMWK